MREGDRRASRKVWRFGRAALAVAIAVAAASSAAPASAATTCSFDAGIHVLTVDGDPDVGSNVRATPAGIVVNHITGSGSTAVDCTGPDPTPANTDEVVVDHADSEATTLSVNHPSGFTPGFTVEMFSGSEVEIEADLGSGEDTFHLSDAGLSDPNNWVLGTLGANWNPVGTIFDDRDIDLSGVEAYSVAPSSGANVFTAQGGSTTGDSLTAPVTYSGGVDVDDVTGGDGPDEVIGYYGADVLRGAAGNDVLDGTALQGPDKDRLIGGTGIDRLKAKDGARDKRLDCGPGDNSQEKASRDPKKDPKPKSC